MVRLGGVGANSSSSSNSSSSPDTSMSDPVNANTIPYQMNISQIIELYTWLVLIIVFVLHFSPSSFLQKYFLIGIRMMWELENFLEPVLLSFCGQVRSSLITVHHSHNASPLPYINRCDMGKVAFNIPLNVMPRGGGGEGKNWDSDKRHAQDSGINLLSSKSPMVILKLNFVTKVGMDPVEHGRFINYNPWQCPWWGFWNNSFLSEYQRSAYLTPPPHNILTGVRIKITEKRSSRQTSTPYMDGFMLKDKKLNHTK